MTDLGTLGGLDSQGLAINDSGNVVGWAVPNSGGYGEPFLWNGRKMTPQREGAPPRRPGEYHKAN